jgi:hypothetical protein
MGRSSRSRAAAGRRGDRRLPEKRRTAAGKRQDRHGANVTRRRSHDVEEKVRDPAWTCRDSSERAQQSAGERPDPERQRQLEQDADEESGCVEQPTHLSVVSEQFEVLLNHESQERRDGEGPGSRHPKASRKPGDREADDSEQEQDLRSMVEVLVGGARRCPGQAIGERVRYEDARRNERRDGEPHSRALHDPIIRSVLDESVELQ